MVAMIDKQCRNAWKAEGGKGIQNQMKMACISYIPSLASQLHYNVLNIFFISLS